MARRSLVTGGCGFVGWNLVDALVAHGNEVTVVDVQDKAHRPDLRYVKASITDLGAMREAVDGMDTVFHNASLVHTKQSAAGVVWDVNPGGSKAGEDAPVELFHGCELVDEKHGYFWINDCAMLSDDEPRAWLSLLSDKDSPGFDAVVTAISPKARCLPKDPTDLASAGVRPVYAWEIVTDDDAEPRVSRSPCSRTS